MKTTYLIMEVIRRFARRGIAMLVLASVPLGAIAVLTDVSSSPIAGSITAQTKPNIMLLMDTSGSMSWSHMPDEVESVTGVNSIGYKSSQCNVLYYNPLTVYALPKKPDGTPFPTPNFGTAPYAGYGSYYAAPDATDLSATDLSSGFQAYDAKTLRATTSVPPDRAQAAYYYVYSGAQTLSYATSPCTQTDTGASAAATGGGTWTRVTVSGTSGTGASDERQNFANWYSFYRTRISLIKSAASLAFTPLTDSFRVGFITVEPKDTPTSPAINPSKYVAINDFDLAQRTLWFNKVFSQSPVGASPAREGLARVGRHYAGKQDGINNGMTGDPMQFSCQQNFTIMTTDGYWNAQTETPGGGPVGLDGVTPVGNQDGTLTSNAGLTPRPIFEGYGTDTQVQTDETNSFSYLVCGTDYYISTSQLNQSTLQTTATTSQVTQSTNQITASTAQISYRTSQISQSTLQHTQSTSQISLSTTQQRQSTSQLTASTSQLQRILKQEQSRTEQVRQSTSQQNLSTTQDRQSTSQPTQSTLQTRSQTSRVDQRTTQITISTSQLLQSTSQLNAVTSQLTQSTTQQLASTAQVSASTRQLKSCNALTELCTPVPTGSCSPHGFVSCEVTTTGPTLVASCTPATANAANDYVTTTCATATTGPTGVASCSPAPANSGNGYTSTTCSTANTGPTPVASCAPAGASAGNGFTATTCNTSVSASTPGPSCAPALGNAGNGYTATTCNTVTTGPTGVPSCVPAAAGAGNSYTAKTCNTATTGPTGISSCSPAVAGSGNNWIAATCNTVNTGPTAVSSCSAAPAGSANNWVATTCTPVVIGPVAVPASGAGSCNPSPGTAANGWTTTTCPNVATGPVGVPASGAGSCTAAVANGANSYTATTCATLTTGPTGVTPGSCVATLPTAANSYVTTTCNTATTGPTPVASCTLAGPNAANSYVRTLCPVVTTGPTLVASCANIAAAPGNAYTATTCAITPAVQNWTNVASCSPIAASAGNTYTATYCRSLVTSTVGASSCSPSGPNGSGVSVACNTAVSGPTGVASCVPQTGNGGNGYLFRTCATLTTGPTLVAACVPVTAQPGNSYVATTCATATTGPTLVASCNPAAPNAGNSYTATMCATATTGPTGVSSCTPAAANSGNSYTSTTCNNAVSGPTPAGPSCAAVAASSGNSWVQKTCGTVTTGPTLAASCTPQTASAANSWTDITCATVNTGPTPASSCAPITAGSGNSYVSTTCNTVTTPAANVAACTPVLASAANNWTNTLCNTITNTAGAPSCSVAPANLGNNYTSTTCNTVTTGPTLVASCTTSAAGSANNYVATSCNAVTTGPTFAASCTPSAANAGNNYMATTCAPADRHKIQYATTTLITTSQYSGGILIGTPSVTTSTGAPVDFNGGTCYPAGTEPALPAPNPQRAGLAAGPQPPAGCAAWPCTVTTSNSGASSNSLADVAQYYYVNDLRPTMVDNVPAVGSGPEDDRATWQHMTTFTIGLGVSGTLQYRPDYKSSAAVTGDFAHIRTGSIPAGDTSGTGAVSWPVWPDPALNYDGNAGGNFQLWNNPKAIDDFWHAAVNGRGTYFSAGDPKSVIAGLGSALAGVATRVGSGAGIGFSNFAPTVGDNFSYSPSYVTSDWTGDLKAAQIDITTGVISSTPFWSAQSLLNAKTGPFCDSRNIYLLRMGVTDNKVNFTWNTRTCDASNNPTGPTNTGLNATEMANFASTNVSLLSQYLSMTDGSSGTVDQRTIAAGANLVNFLRGQRGLEAFAPNMATNLYRARAQVLGDIVGGQPVYVKAPFANYQDTGYASFKASNATRTPMVYVPANDGMLHAFYAGTNITDPLGGQEAWAIIPSTVLPNLYKLADDNYKNNHQFFVDGTPTVGDAYDGTSSSWKTILVAGLGAGGRGYYALDVTDPAAPKGLWEFKWDPSVAACPTLPSAATGNTADCHLGLTFGHPIISKLIDGTWVVMFTSGYNNINAPTTTGDGGGYLYVMNAFSGQIMYKISTGVGSAGTPSGLAQINNFVDAAILDNTTKQVYGGDLFGNVWRFDVNDTIAPGGREATLIGTATDAGGTPQPITARPELAELGTKPMIFVGTGRLLGASDFADAQGQSVYGIVDPMTGNPAFPNLRAALAPLAMTASASIRTVACTGTSMECGSTSGWVVDLPDSGERVNIDMQLARGTLVFASNVPQQSACLVGGHSWLNFLSFGTGLAVNASPGLAVSVQSVDQLAVGTNLIEIQGRTVAVRQLAGGPSLPHDVPSDDPLPKGKRISWREIAQ